MFGREEDTEHRVGTTAGAFAIDELLGVGATSLVYRAHHPTLGAVALKILRRECLADPEVAPRFRREVELLRLVAHPNVVAVHGDAITDDGVPAIALELIEGSTVARRRPRTLGEVVGVATQVLQAIEACHAVNLLHRDLKPTNVLVTRDDRVKLIDFGSAHVIGARLTQRRLAIGTPSYMAPEQARGDSTSVATDVYGVGALIYALLVRSAPRREGDDDNYQRIGRETVMPLALAAPHIPFALASAVDRAMTWEPAARWPSARAFHDALAALPMAVLEKMTRPVVETIPETPTAMRDRDSRPTLPDALFVRRV